MFNYLYRVASQFYLIIWSIIIIALILRYLNTRVAITFDYIKKST
jgi:hypothetical protein